MLEVKSMSKWFGNFPAVSNISFQAKEGEIVGFLGPNGAGKSTTMKMITGFLEISEGNAFILGHSIKDDELLAKKEIGYVPENAPLYDDLYVREFLLFMASMRDISDSSFYERIASIISLCGLKEVEFQKIETLSKGYRRRVSLAQALIHDPKILILDEPTDGLDPNQKHEVRELIRKLAIKKCIMISTHILEEVEEICDRVMIINHGKLLYEGTPQELKSKSNKGQLKDVFRAMTKGINVEGVTL